MQLSHFWRELRTEFQALADSVCEHTGAQSRLQGWEADVVGGDASTRAQFRQLAKRGGVALGADLDDALERWLTAVREYLQREGIPWLGVFESSTWKAGPTEMREMDISMVHPLTTRLAGIENWLELPDFIKTIRNDGLHELLIVVADGPMYAVLDDDREHLKYLACIAAGVTSLTCGIRNAWDEGTKTFGSAVEIDCVSMASVQLCTALETEAFAARMQEQMPVSAEASRKEKVGGLKLAAWLRDEMPLGTAREAEEKRSPASSERCSGTWGDVGIAFISDERVQVTTKARTYTQNYSEMGFENRKTGKPNLAWVTLRALAQKGGAIRVAIRERKVVEKRMQEIRKTLRAHLERERFDIPRDSEPLPYHRGGMEYRALFQIGKSPSFDA